MPDQLGKDMAGKRQKKTGKWEFVVKRAGVLEKPLYLTFDTEEEGDTYCVRLDALLDKGIIPTEYRSAPRVSTVQHLVREYERDAHPKPKDMQMLSVAIKQHGLMALSKINSAWVDGWISSMKRVEKLAPDTVRARIGAMARATDWGIRNGLLVLPDQPFRTLPSGYSQYTKLDAQHAGTKRVDVERDRRLEPGELEKIFGVLERGVLPRKQRPLVLDHVPALRCMMLVAIESAMRLREQYTLTVDQVDLKRRTIFLDKTKNGDKRQVPLSTAAVAALSEYMDLRGPGVHLYPWWGGDASNKALTAMSDYLSKLYAGIFEEAGAKGLRFHDLRHEAVSRMFERTRLTESQIMKVAGHKSHRMMLRYANLRGSDLADLLG